MSERAYSIYDLFEKGVEEGKTDWIKLEREMRDRFAVLGNVTLSDKARQDPDVYEAEIYDLANSEATQYGEMKEKIVDRVVTKEEALGHEFGKRAIIPQLRKAMDELYPSERNPSSKGRRMAEKLQTVRGTHDLLPADYAKHQHVIDRAQGIAANYGYARMDTPIFEFTDVFHRTLGDTSDVVTKETYTFMDRGNESITLRPEFTAAIVRSFISNGLQQHVPFKVFYAGPAFRYERPQKGRQRQFHQIGCEILGAGEPQSDVEMIALAAHTLKALGLGDSVALELNSLGDAASRVAYREALVAYLSKYKNDLSEDSKTRLEKNPLRILDSKDEGDRKIVAGAPTLHTHFNEASTAHFAAVKAGLESLGIKYTVSEKLVRGLDYYSHTVFEFTTDKLGAQGTVLAGGRYNDLVKLMGGNDTACIGFAAGVERLAALLEQPVEVQKPFVSVIPMQDEVEGTCWKIAQDLRHAGIATDIGFKGKAGKRFEKADKLGAKFAIVVGEVELAKGEAMVKNLADGTQTPVKLTELTNWLKSR